MKIAFKGLWGRVRETLLHIILVGAVAAFITALLTYTETSNAALRQQRFSIYGEWQMAEFELAKTELENMQAFPSVTAHGVATQCGNVVVPEQEMRVIGGIGSVDAEFIRLGHVELLSGRLPQNEGEIALTTSILDALGYSYELGQQVELNVASLLNEQDIQTLRLQLCGILPSYDIFWALGAHYPVNAVVARPLVGLGEPVYQLYYTSASFDSSKFDITAYMETTAVNLFAYPQFSIEKPANTILLTGCLLFGLCAIWFAVYASLRRKKRQTGILYAIGATKRSLIAIGLWEAVFVLGLGLPLGVLAGLGSTATATMFTSGTLQESMVIPWARLLLFLFLHGLAVLLGFLAPTMILVHSDMDISQMPKRAALRKKFAVTPPLHFGEIAAPTLNLLLVYGCLFLATWQMLPYNLNRQNACMNIQATSAGYLDEQLIDDLLALPYVEDVTAMYYSGAVKTLYSEATRSDPVIQDMAANTFSNFNFGFGFDENGDVKTVMATPSEKDLLMVAAWCEEPIADMDEVLRGDAIVLYLPYYEKSSVDSNYTFAMGDPNDDYEPVEINIHAGDFITISIHISQEEQYEKEVRIAGIIRKFPPESRLLTNNIPIFSTVFFGSEALAVELETAARGSEFEFGYSHINIALADGLDFSARKSIASIVTKRGGLLTTDSYQIVSQYYLNGTQGYFLFSVAGILIGMLGLLISNNVFSASLEQQRRNIGVLQSLGATPKQLRHSYILRFLKLLLFAVVPASALMAAWVLFLPRRLLSDYITLFSMAMFGDTYSIQYPWLAHLLICALYVAIIVFYYAIALGRILRKTPYENIKAVGGV